MLTCCFGQEIWITFFYDIIHQTLIYSLIAKLHYIGYYLTHIKVTDIHFLVWWCKQELTPFLNSISFWRVNYISCMYIIKTDIYIYIYFSIYFVADQRYSDFVFKELPNIDIMNFINNVLEFGLSHTCIYVYCLSVIFLFSIKICIMTMTERQYIHMIYNENTENHKILRLNWLKRTHFACMK